ncbi:hypothetical protein FQR65_LT11860 [Abscondita terminalis]|nr:hypothetical protein FQR65_LT11860 [Abscondita terminalis]
MEDYRLHGLVQCKYDGRHFIKHSRIAIHYWKCHMNEVEMERRRSNSMSTVSCQGFDPIGIRQKLMKIKGFSVDEIAKLIYLFLARGTNLDKIKATMTPEGREFLSKGSTKYDLKSKIAGGRKDTANLARLAACFPVCVVGALKKCAGQISRPFSPSEYEIASKVPFPMLLCSNVTAGVLPKNEFEVCYT